MSNPDDLSRKNTAPENHDAPARDPWDSPEGAEILERMHSLNPALAAEVERGRARRSTLKSS